MSLNTLYQLSMDLRDAARDPGWADRFLNIGDYFNYLLSGIPKGEATLASTTQLYDPRTGRLGLGPDRPPGPAHAASSRPWCRPAPCSGPLLPGIAAETGLKDAQVVATCSHDTAAAVAAVPRGRPGLGLPLLAAPGP